MSDQLNTEESRQRLLNQLDASKQGFNELDDNAELEAIVGGGFIANHPIAAVGGALAVGGVVGFGGGFGTGFSAGKAVGQAQSDSSIDVNIAKKKKKKKH
jgi:hypothetical protein